MAQFDDAALATTASMSSTRSSTGTSTDARVHPVVAVLHDVFVGLPHVMFCVKDADGRYVAVNQAFVERAGRSVEAVLGRTASELFPADLAASYEAQDRRVLATGEAIRNELELILRPDGSRGWYVSAKTRLFDDAGDLVGLASVSYDLRSASARDDAGDDPHQRLRVRLLRPELVHAPVPPGHRAPTGPRSADAGEPGNRARRTVDSARVRRAGGR